LLHHCGNPAAHTEGEHHETQIYPPRVLLIAFVLAGSAGAASAATATSSGSWFTEAGQLIMACASGNSVACMAAGGGAGTVNPDTVTNPTIINK
jgi:hypothetical protein